MKRNSLELISSVTEIYLSECSKLYSMQFKMIVETGHLIFVIL